MVLCPQSYSHLLVSLCLHLWKYTGIYLLRHGMGLCYQNFRGGKTKMEDFPEREESFVKALHGSWEARGMCSLRVIIEGGLV